MLSAAAKVEKEEEPYSHLTLSLWHHTHRHLLCDITVCLVYSGQGHVIRITRSPFGRGCCDYLLDINTSQW